MQITIKNIKHWIEGNGNMLLNSIGMLPEQIIEQVAYRSLKCIGCLSEGKCKYCGCDLPGKFYVTESCNNGDIFPDLMNEEDWNKFKIDNEI